MKNLDSLCWPADRLHEVVALLSDTEVITETGSLSATPSDQWIAWAAERVGISIEGVDVTVSDVEDALSSYVPAFIELPSGGFLALESSQKQHVTVVSPSGRRHRVLAEDIAQLLLVDIEAEHAELLASLFGKSGRSASRAKRSFIREVAGQRKIGRLYAIDLRDSEALPTRLRDFGSAGRLLRLILAYIGIQGAWIGSWIIIGAGALLGTIDSGRLLGWALLLLSMAPLRGYATWLEGKIAIDIGLALKGRLMQGALKLDAQTIQGQGVSRLLGQVIESDTVERSLVRGGVAGLFAVIEIIAAVFILALSTSPFLVLSLAGILLGAVAFWSYTHVQRQTGLVDSRMTLTGSLIETMIGYRTRTVQAPDAESTQKEANEFDRYFRATESVDSAKLWLATGLPRAWMFAATTLVAIQWWWATPSIQTAAVTIGGIVLFYRALVHLSEGALSLADALVAWNSVQDVYKAAELLSDTGDTSALLPVVPSTVEVRNVGFRYPGSSDEVLKDVSMSVAPGDRILMEGPSGSGKSTLALILAGITAPTSGLMLAGGVDRPSLGEQGWRRRVVAAPQFDSNHVLIGPFAFNLLMGRRWPPTQDDLLAAQEICNELGLDELLSRMPSGPGQPVGEIGWQMSHGEKSRLFIARSLLQEAPTIILDESLSALDPATLIRTMKSIQKRAGSLIVVAHP